MRILIWDFEAFLICSSNFIIPSPISGEGLSNWL